MIKLRIKFKVKDIFLSTIFVNKVKIKTYISGHQNYNKIVSDMRSITKITQFKGTFLANKFTCMFSSNSILYQDVAFTKSHEWVETVSAQKRVRVGITDFAQQQLG